MTQNQQQGQILPLESRPIIPIQPTSNRTSLSSSQASIFQPQKASIVHPIDPNFDKSFAEEFEKLRIAQTNMSNKQKNLLDSSINLSNSQLNSPLSKSVLVDKNVLVKVAQDYHSTLDASLLLLENEVIRRDKELADLKEHILQTKRQQDSLSKSIFSLSSAPLNYSQIPDKVDPLSNSIPPSNPSTPSSISQPVQPTTPETPSNVIPHGYPPQLYQPPNAYSNFNPYYYQPPYPQNPQKYPSQFGKW
jgi:hypothetical protein